MAALRPLTLSFSARARLQLLAIDDYIRRYAGSDTAKRVGTNIYDAANVLRHFPEAGRLGRVAGTREWVVRHSPYIIVYEVYADQSELVVLGVFHCRQNRP